MKEITSVTQSAILEKNLTPTQRDELYERFKKTPGVLSVEFNTAKTRIKYELKVCMIDSEDTAWIFWGANTGIKSRTNPKYK